MPHVDIKCFSGKTDEQKLLCAEQVTKVVADDNKPSVALLRKFGFSEDRESCFKKWGEETYFDAHYFKLEL